MGESTFVLKMERKIVSGFGLSNDSSEIVSTITVETKAWNHSDAERAMKVKMPGWNAVGCSVKH